MISPLLLPLLFLLGPDFSVSAAGGVGRLSDIAAELAAAAELEGDILWQEIAKLGPTVLSDFGNTVPDCIVQKLTLYTQSAEGIARHASYMGEAEVAQLSRLIMGTTAGAVPKLKECFEDAALKCSTMTGPNPIQDKAKPTGCNDLIYHAEKLVWVATVCIGMDDVLESIDEGAAPTNQTAKDAMYIRDDIETLLPDCVSEHLRNSLTAVRAQIPHLTQADAVVAGVVRLKAAYEIYRDSNNYEYIDTTRKRGYEQGFVNATEPEQPPEPETAGKLPGVDWVPGTPQQEQPEPEAEEIPDELVSKKPVPLNQLTGK